MLCFSFVFFTEKNPISYNGKSYARYSLTNPFERHLSIAVSVRTVQATGNLMYAAGIRDYSILEASKFVKFEWYVFLNFGNLHFCLFLFVPSLLKKLV